MLKNLNLDNVLFLDIETVPQFARFEDVPETLQKLWEDKASRIVQNNSGETPASLYHRAGIYAEFGKIICISAGYITGAQFRLKSYYGDNEKELLADFSVLLNRHYNTSQHFLCAHNGKEFDFPYIARRMLVNRLTIPDILNLAGKKPWEVQHLDTMDLWRFGDYKNYTSLNLLTTIFGIPSPKDDIDGSMVNEVYWKENDLERIVTYCQKDTLAVAQLLLSYLGQPLIKESQIMVV
ncbi:MAG: 3'-5' exonuclease [Sphingobacteriia bacterium]|nr:3'-5' exonuclease [Sphingobacteriia bacterium]